MTTWRLVLLTLLAIVLIHQVHGETAAQCIAHRRQCGVHVAAKNVTGILESCQSCFSACHNLPSETVKTVLKYWSDCVNQCVTHDCIAKGASSRITVTPLFRCKVYGRWCYFDDKYRSDKQDLLRKSCGTCAKVCNQPDVDEDRKYCENRCIYRSFSCAANNTARTIPIPNPVPSRKPDPTPIKSQSNLWEWLGPVLGAVATIIGAVITVAWVRDFQHSRPVVEVPVLPDSSPPPPVQNGYDDGWPDPYGSTGVSGLFEQGVPQPPPSRLRRFFGNS